MSRKRLGPTKPPNHRLPEVAGGRHLDVSRQDIGHQRVFGRRRRPRNRHRPPCQNRQGLPQGSVGQWLPGAASLNVFGRYPCGHARSAPLRRNKTPTGETRKNPRLHGQRSGDPVDAVGVLHQASSRETARTKLHCKQACAHHRPRLNRWRRGNGWRRGRTAPCGHQDHQQNRPPHRDSLLKEVELLELRLESLQESARHQAVDQAVVVGQNDVHH